MAPFHKDGVGPMTERRSGSRREKAASRNSFERGEGVPGLPAGKFEPSAVSNQPLGEDGRDGTRSGVAWRR